MEFEWPGFVGYRVSFPRRCCDSPPCPPTCNHYVEGGAGQYVLSIFMGNASTEELERCAAAPNDCVVGTPFSTFLFDYDGTAESVEIDLVP